jgi:hypothetical protein
MTFPPQFAVLFPLLHIKDEINAFKVAFKRDLTYVHTVKIL